MSKIPPSHAVRVPSAPHAPAAAGNSESAAGAAASVPGDVSHGGESSGAARVPERRDRQEAPTALDELKRAMELVQAAQAVGLVAPNTQYHPQRAMFQGQAQGTGQTGWVTTQHRFTKSSEPVSLPNIPYKVTINVGGQCGRCGATVASLLEQDSLAAFLWCQAAPQMVTPQGVELKP